MCLRGRVVTGPGSELGQALVEHPLIDKIAFTGSTAVGRRVAQTAAQTLKRVTLELGGKSPSLVFEDADRLHPKLTCGISIVGPPEVRGVEDTSVTDEARTGECDRPPWLAAAMIWPCTASPHAWSARRASSRAPRTPERGPRPGGTI